MEKTAREVIKDTIGISVDAGDMTPMDYGECVRCMELYANLHSSQLKEELSALMEELERLSDLAKVMESERDHWCNLYNELRKQSREENERLRNLLIEISPPIP